ncbi:fungal-specific transcription factor domain-containing protein [Xylogone sp. PMI_703]|nr:fungal-specific transcription factor domain-containing protein [Xylogone sp. PMI_703]
MRRYSDTGQSELRSFNRPGAPSRSHSSTKTGAAIIACATCRTKKIKCDSGRPICGQCKTDGAACKYVEWKKTGLPRGYVRSLEAQVKALKVELEELRTHQSLHNDGADPDNNTQLPVDMQLELPSDKIESALLLEKYSPSSLSDYDILIHDPFEIARLAISDLLTIAEQEFLVSLYFSNCHPFIPIIHKPTFDTKRDTQGTHVLLSVFALACRHNTDFSRKAEIFYGLAKQATQATYMNPDISTLVALLLQAVYEIGHPNTSVHCVTTIGAALALASSFRLLRMDEEHADKRNQWIERPKNWIEEEGRRRAFLMVLSISRWGSTVQQRELGFPVKKEISVYLPISDQVWFAGGHQRPRTEPITSLSTCSDLGPFARFVQAQGLYSKVNDFNQSYPLREASENERELSRIDSLIQNFIITFAPKWQDPLLDGEHLLDPTTLAMVHCASLLLHHPIVHKYKKDRNGASRKRCSAGAENILDIIHLIHKNPKVGNYMLPHPLVIAARVRLLELLEQRGHYRGRDTDLIVSALHSLGKNWGMQEKLVDHATRLEANKMPFSEPLTAFEPKNEGPVPRQRAISLVQQRSLYSRASMNLSIPGMGESSINMDEIGLQDPVLDSGSFSVDNDIFSWPAEVFSHNWQIGEGPLW